MPESLIKLHIDGEEKLFYIPDNIPLVTLLKRENYKGLRQACDGGDCGGCTILLDKKPVLSCMMHARQAEGKEILSIEGIQHYNEDLKLLPICLKRMGASQCGFCTCGFIMAIAGLYFKKRSPSREEIIRAVSGNLCRCTGYEKIILAVELFFDIINGRAILPEADGGFAPFGKRVDKVDGDGLTQGKSLYVTDMNVPNQLILKFKLAAKAHALITEIDVSEAEKIPGVALILTHKNVPQARFSTAAQGYLEPSPFDTRLFDNKVRFHGEPIAAVIAESEETALKAVELIRVEYEELPVMLSFEDAYFKPLAQIHTDPAIKNAEDVTRNLAASFLYEDGNLQWNDDVIVTEGLFETSKQQHVHLEPHAALCYMDEKSKLHCFASTQVPFDVRHIISKLLELPKSRIRVVKPRIGGGFGGKQEIVVEAVTALAAYRLGKPVKCVMERKEEFTFARTRHPFRVYLKLGANQEGQLLNLEADLLSDTGAYGGHASTVAELTVMRLSQLYRIPNVKIQARAIYTNKSPAGAFRGYGEPQVIFPLETLVDELAQKLDISPITFRKKNHLRVGDYLRMETLFIKPYPLGEKIETCLLEQLIDRGAELIKWEERKAPDTDYYYGKGMAISMQGSGIPNITRSQATVSLNEDGSVQVFSGASDIGTGADTILTQIAAETLSIPMDRIYITTADTDTTPYDSGAYASNTTYFAGDAVHRACLKLKNEILSWASEKYKLDKEKLRLENAAIIAPGKDLPLEEVALAMFSDPEHNRTVFHATVKKDTHSPPFVATFVALRVDKKTGKILVDTVVQVLDCGKIVNPTLAEGQIEGTTVQALGFALYEDLNYTKDGRVSEKGLFSYKIPTVFEKPQLIAAFIESHEPSGPLGLKSVGEIAFSAVTPAINNALFDACGIRLQRVPFLPEKVLNALKAKKD